MYEMQIPIVNSAIISGQQFRKFATCILHASYSDYNLTCTILQSYYHSCNPTQSIWYIQATPHALN